MSGLISMKFEGHKAPVLSLDYSSETANGGGGGGGQLLLSGSEDRTARLWDVRDSRRRASLCIPVQGEVLSVKFAPRLPPAADDDDDDEAAAAAAMEVDDSPSAPTTTNPFAKDHTMYVRV
jgi:WD40 repeat protein